MNQSFATFFVAFVKVYQRPHTFPPFQIQEVCKILSNCLAGFIFNFVTCAVQLQLFDQIRGFFAAMLMSSCGKLTIFQRKRTSSCSQAASFLALAAKAMPMLSLQGLTRRRRPCPWARMPTPSPRRSARGRPGYRNGLRFF